jgi:putative resolvase
LGKKINSKKKYFSFASNHSTAHLLPSIQHAITGCMNGAACDVYLRPKDIRKKYAVSASTLRNWAANGTIEALSYGSSNKRLYSQRTIEHHLGVTSTQQPQAKSGIIYARVSSRAQEVSGDLQRQVGDLQTAYPQHQVITDVASGLNFKRRGLQTLLERVYSGVVSEVVVMHKDRLCRYGLELICFILEKAGTKLVVHGNAAPEDRTQELADDLLAITTIFVARHHGQRSATNKRRRTTGGADAGGVDESSAAEGVQVSRVSH